MALKLEEPTGAAVCLRIGLTIIPAPAYARAHGHKNFRSHRYRCICQYLSIAGAVSESLRVAFSIANARKASRDQKSQAESCSGNASHPFTLAGQV